MEEPLPRLKSGRKRLIKHPKNPTRIGGLQNLSLTSSRNGAKNTKGSIMDNAKKR